MLPEPAHLLPSPAGNGTVIYAQGLVRYDEVLADSDDLAESAADGTGSERAVETEHVLVRFPECHPVRLEAVVELAHLRPGAGIADHVHLSEALRETGGYGGKQPGPEIGVHFSVNLHPVHHQHQSFRE